MKGSGFHQFLVSPQLGGAAKVGLALARWLHDREKPVRVWTPGKGPAAVAAIGQGLPNEQYPLSLMQRGPLGRLLGAPRLLAGTRGRGGLAHVHSPGGYRAVGASLRLAGMRTVVHVHIAPGDREIAWAFATPPDLVITCARFLVPIVRAGLEEAGVSVPVVPVANAIDTDRFRPGNRCIAKHSIGAPPNRPLLLMLANLAPHKGQETAIRAMAILRRRGLEAECWLAGVERDGSDQFTRRLQALCHELGVADRVRFLGAREDAPLLLQAADFLLLPSTHEGLPLTILEAQATGTPVLAAPTHGIPEVVDDGKTGLLIPAADAAGYADHIERLWEAPNLSRRIAEAALVQVRKEHDWETYCRRVAQLYEQVSAVAPWDRGRSAPPVTLSPSSR